VHFYFWFLVCWGYCWFEVFFFFLSFSVLFGGGWFDPRILAEGKEGKKEGRKEEWRKAQERPGKRWIILLPTVILEGGCF